MFVFYICESVSAFPCFFQAQRCCLLGLHGNHHLFPTWNPRDLCLLRVITQLFFLKLSGVTTGSWGKMGFSCLPSRLGAHGMGSQYNTILPDSCAEMPHQRPSPCLGSHAQICPRTMALFRQVSSSDVSTISSLLFLPVISQE